MDNDHQYNNHLPPVRQESPPSNVPPPIPSTPEGSRQELQQAIQGSNEILATAHTTLTPFPDTVTLDRAKLTITKRTFFSTADVASIPIDDILNVTVHMGPLFATIKVTTRVMSAGKPFSIALFWRKDAVNFKNIAQGYVLGLQRKIDLSLLSRAELTKMLAQLGEDDHHAP